MFNQLKIALYKLMTFPIYYIAMIFMFVIGIVYGYIRFDDVSNTSEIFSYLVCDTSFVFIYEIISAWFISIDFGNRTITYELKNGYSRLSIILTRTIVVSIPTIVLHLLYIVATIIGFSISHSFDISVFCVQNLLWFVTIMLQLTAINCLVVMICFAVKKTAGGIAISVATSAVLCNILRNFLMNTKIFTLSCFCLAQSNDNGSLIISGMLAIIYAAIFFFMAFLLFFKTDIK